MPKVSNKRKKQASSEEENSASDASDSSGPADRNPPPGAKKGAGAVKKPAASASAKTEDGDPSWPLDKNRSVKVRSFKGSTYIDIREYYEKDGKQLPGKKGISLSVNQWNKLKSYIPEVDKAVEDA